MLVDERGGHTRTEYDANRNPIKATYPDGSQTTSKYDGTYGNLLEHTDARGTQSAYEYDSHGRLTRQTEAVGLPEQRVTEYAYDAFGQRTSETIKGATPDDDSTTTWTCDEYGNAASVTNPLGYTTTYTYLFGSARLHLATRVAFTCCP